MFKCHVCGSEESGSELVSEVFRIEGKFYLVENIPAIVCAHCGEQVFSRDTTEDVRVMLHGTAQPVRSVSMDVFAFPRSH